MKKRFSVVLSLLLLTIVFSGCTDTSSQTETAKDHPNSIGGTEGNAPEQLEEIKIAEYSYQYTNMKLKLPTDWEYEILEGTVEASKNNLGIRFWPKNQPTITISLLYYVNGIGLCGTGVTFEDIVLENGLTATKCTEDIDDDHCFILIYKDVPGAYAAKCCVPKSMWADYEDTVMSILGSAEIGRNLLSESEAIEAAKGGVTVSYDTIRAYFDYISGVWEIQFTTTHTVGEDQIVRIDAQGNRI